MEDPVESGPEEQHHISLQQGAGASWRHTLRVVIRQHTLPWGSSNDLHNVAHSVVLRTVAHYSRQNKTKQNTINTHWCWQERQTSFLNKELHLLLGPAIRCALAHDDQGPLGSAKKCHCLRDSLWEGKRGWGRRAPGGGGRK